MNTDVAQSPHTVCTQITVFFIGLSSISSICICICICIVLSDHTCRRAGVRAATAAADRERARRLRVLELADSTERRLVHSEVCVPQVGVCASVRVYMCVGWLGYGVGGLGGCVCGMRGVGWWA